MSSLRLFHKEEVVGKTVIDSTGKVTGKVKDVVFSLDGPVILVVEKKDGSEMQVSLAMVAGLSEFVVTKNEGLVTPPSTGATSGTGTEGRSCKFCGIGIPSGSIYCPSCGKSQT